MPKLLTIADHLASSRRIRVLNGTHLVYEVIEDFSHHNPTTWRLTKNDVPLLSIVRDATNWRPTWNMHGNLGSFAVKRKLRLWGRRYDVVGGDFDCAQITSSLFGATNKVVWNRSTIATARRHSLVAFDRQGVQLFDIGEAAETFSICALALPLIDSRARTGQSESDSDSDDQ